MFSAAERERQEVIDSDYVNDVLNGGSAGRAADSEDEFTPTLDDDDDLLA